MKLLMILGGCIGFGIGVAFGLASGSGWPSTLWRAALAAYLAGLLMRWWGRLWIKSLKHVLLEKQASALKAEEQQLAKQS
jgi:hypothetical protein